MLRLLHQTNQHQINHSQASMNGRPFDNDYILTNDGSGNNPETSNLYQETTQAPCDENLFSHIHTYCGIVVNHSIFQRGILVFIALNSILMAVATFDFVADDPSIQSAFDVMDVLFLTIFTIELLLHLVYYGPSFFSDGWLLFDFMVVILSWASEALSVFRAFRVVRTFRVITKMKEMKDLVGALINVMPRMFAIFLLLFLIYFVFAVLFTEIFKTTYEEGYTSQDYFSRLDKTTFTLLQFMFLDSWSTITKELMQKYWWAWVPVLCFIVVSTFIVVNLIIAVICDAVAAIQTQEMTKHVDEMQHLTSDAMAHNEAHHRQEIARLETKIDQLTTLLSAMNFDQARTITSSERKDL